MARNTASLPNANAFKTATTDQEALIILIQKTDRLRNIFANLADNDLVGDALADAAMARTATLMQTLATQLQNWLALQNI